MSESEQKNTVPVALSDRIENHRKEAQALLKQGGEQAQYDLLQGQCAAGNDTKHPIDNTRGSYRGRVHRSHGVWKHPPGVAIQSDGVLRPRLQQVFVKYEGEWWIEAYHNVDVKN